MTGLQLLLYIGLMIFIVGTIYKLIRIAKMPLHIRWDLYPIPHEKGKGSYGGSYFEEIDWWTKPAETTSIGELVEMGKEIFFIQSMYHHNRPLWIFSFPFHIGLYLLIGFVALTILGGLLELSGVTVSAAAGGFGLLIFTLTRIFALVGSILVALGAVGLLISRMARHELRAASVWTDYFNLLLLGAVGVTLFALCSTPAGDFHSARSVAASVMTFSSLPQLGTLAAVHLALGALFLLWLPATHMTHFVGKYFTYHKVRWEDHPNIRGGKIEKAVTTALGYKITWSAKHIKSGGTWAGAATANDKEESSKK